MLPSTRALALALALAGVAAMILTTACQTLGSARFRSEATASTLDGADAYQINFKITEVLADKEIVIATPRLVFRAGQPANVRVESDIRVINAEAYVQRGQKEPLCLVKTRIHEKGRLIFHHSELIKPSR